MHNLPFETLERIFHLACTDGGSTGNALSLVSKHVRAIARTTRFHSIALAASPRRLQAFLALYERERDPTRGDKPRIRHLHVTFPRIEDYSPSLSARGRSLSPSTRRLPRSRRCRVQEDSKRPSPDFVLPATASHCTTATTGVGSDGALQPNLRSLDAAPLPVPPVHPSPRGHGSSTDFPVTTAAARQIVLQDARARGSSVKRHPDPIAYPEYIRAARTLFRLVTPDLVTLVVQCGFSFGGCLRLPIIERPFPHLREAAFVGVADPSALLTNEAFALTTTPLFPAMTHLSISIAYTGCGTMLHSFWPSRAPRVTHLAVSRADHGMHDIAMTVGVRLDPRAPLTPRYPSVRCLLLQPSPATIGAWGEASSRTETQTAFLWMQRRVGLDCEAIGVEVIVANAPEHGEAGSYYARARRGWLERIEDDRDEAGSWGLTVIPEDAVEGPLPTSCTVWRELFPRSWLTAVKVCAGYRGR